MGKPMVEEMNSGTWSRQILCIKDVLPAIMSPTIMIRTCGKSLILLFMASIKKNDNGLYFQRHIAVHPCRALDGPHMGTNLRCGWMFRWRLLPDAAECAAMVAIRDAVVP